jgi:transcriptional regulator with XRE-family HTH domain
MTNREDKALNEAFKKRVAAEFIKARDRAKEDGESIEEFVLKLGITRAALCKYVNRKAIPSLRVLSRARMYYGVNLSYGELGDSYLKLKKKDPRQMELQFSMSEISKDQIEIKKFSPKGDSSVELLIRIDFSKGA